jgi:hypothetical protein
MINYKELHYFWAVAEITQTAREWLFRDVPALYPKEFYEGSGCLDPSANMSKGHASSLWTRSSGAGINLTKQD